MDDAVWLHVLANESLEFKILGLLSHIPLAVAAFWAAKQEFALSSVLLSLGTLMSLGYHTCGSFDVCAGHPFNSWRSGDYSTVAMIALAGLNLLLLPRFLMRTVVDMGRQKFHAPNTRRRSVTTTDPLRVADAQFATARDVPGAIALYYKEIVLGMQIAFSNIVRIFDPISFKALVTIGLLATTPALAYAYVFFTDTVRVTHGRRSHYVVLPIFNFKWDWMLAALVFGGAAAFFFFLDALITVETSAAHSAWHFCIGIAFIFAIESIARAERDDALQQLIEHDMASDSNKKA